MIWVRNLALCALVALSACSGGVQGISRGLVAEGGTGTQGAGPLEESRYMELAQAAQPGESRAMMVASLQRNTKSILVLLSRAADGTETWLTEGGGSFSLRDGMLVATRKVPPDMMSADASQTLALVRDAREGRAERFQSYLDGENRVYLRSYVCDITRGEPQRLDLIAGSRQSLTMIESCTGLDEDFRNVYWIDPESGEILTSLQYTSPEAGSFLFQEVRP